MRNNISLSHVGVMLPVKISTGFLQLTQFKKPSSGLGFDLVDTAQGFCQLGSKVLKADSLVRIQLPDLSEDSLSTFALVLINLFDTKLLRLHVLAELQLLRNGKHTSCFIKLERLSLRSLNLS